MLKKTIFRRPWLFIFSVLMVILVVFKLSFCSIYGGVGKAIIIENKSIAKYPFYSREFIDPAMSGVLAKKSYDDILRLNQTHDQIMLNLNTNTDESHTNIAEIQINSIHMMHRGETK